MIREKGGDVDRAVSGCRDAWKHALAAALDPQGKPSTLPARRYRKASLHTVHPFLFHGAFPEVPRETVRELAVADRLFTEHLLHYDRTLDRPADAYPGLLFLSQLEQAFSLRRLYRLLPPENSFWKFFFRCHEESWRSVQEEWLGQCHGQGPASLSRCLDLAMGKTALLKPCTVALAFLAGRSHDQAWISRALDYHHAGLVLLDDLEDWKEDFLRGNHTFLLTRVFHRAGLQKSIERGDAIPPAKIGNLLYREGEAERQLRRAEVCFRKALRTPEPYTLPLWKTMNQRYMARCRSARSGILSWKRRKTVSFIPPQKEKARGPVRIFLHPDEPSRRFGVAVRIVERFQALFPTLAPQELTLGTWNAMPSHFCLPDRRNLRCAVNLASPVSAPPVTSVSRIPLRMKIVLALVASARYRLHGPDASLLEQLFIRGLGLEICRMLWPERRENHWLRMPPMERLWYANHEPYLWEKLEPYLEASPSMGRRPTTHPFDRDLHACFPVPGTVLLFLGFRFFSYVRSRSLNPEPESAFRKKPAALAQEMRRYLQR